MYLCCDRLVIYCNIFVVCFEHIDLKAYNGFMFPFVQIKYFEYKYIRFTILLR